MMLLYILAQCLVYTVIALEIEITWLYQDIINQPPNPVFYINLQANGIYSRNKSGTVVVSPHSKIIFESSTMINIKCNASQCLLE